MPVEDLGVRRVIARNAIVLDRRDGLFPLMCLPARLFLGGRLGRRPERTSVDPCCRSCARSAVSARAQKTRSAPTTSWRPVPSSNAEFMKAVCVALKRPYWLHAPAPLMRFWPGEMADLVLKGRVSTPRRLLECGLRVSSSRISTPRRVICWRPESIQAGPSQSKCNSTRCGAAECGILRADP